MVIDSDQQIQGYDGGCSDVVKAKNAEDFGFKAIFIAESARDYKKLEDGDISAVEHFDKK